jgi:hypothetical protein
MSKHSSELAWQSPEALVTAGFEKSRVVMLNDCHSGMNRSIRARNTAAGLLPVAHRLGVRHIAMETISTTDLAEEINRTRRLPHSAQDADLAYFEQPEMRQLIETALALGWTFIAYDGGNGEREYQQARTLSDALGALPPQTKLLVISGNGHSWKEPVEDPVGLVANLPGSPHLFMPMGGFFRQLSAIDPFVINQCISVDLPRRHVPWVADVLHQLPATVTTAGLLQRDLPAAARPTTTGADAFILSTDNRMD